MDKDVLSATAKAAITILTRPVGKARLRSELRRAQPPLKVHVGAAARRLPGWLNTDVGWRPSLFLDITRPWPVLPGTVSHVYADNVIEHLSMEANRAFFRNAFRAMASGGVIRLATPDVESRARCYLEDADTTWQHIERDRKAGYPAYHSVDLLRVTFQECGHHRGYLWDLEALAKELEAAGFRDPSRQAMGESEDPNLRGLEWREGTQQVLELVVEATKPGG